MANTSQDLEAARIFDTRISSVHATDEHRAREVGLSLLDARPGERILEVGFERRRIPAYSVVEPESSEFTGV